MANSNWSNAGHFYAPQVKPVLLNCSFVVNDGQPDGVLNLKGPGVSAVYMYSTSPSAANPVPSNGGIVVKLAQNFQRYLGGFAQVTAPLSGSDIQLDSGSLSQGESYVITSLGTTTTTANWVAAGLPVGVTPAVGAAFVCTAAGATGTGLGDAQVKSMVGSQIMSIEVIGDPTQTIAGQSPSGPTGAQLIFKCWDSAGAQIAPVNGTKISLSFYLSDSSITVQGQ